MPERSLTAQKLGRLVFRTLGVSTDDEVEIQRDRLNANRILVIRYPKNSGKGPLAPASETAPSLPTPTKEQEKDLRHG